LHVAQLMLLPLTVSCFSKIQIGFTFLLPAYPGSPGQRAIKRVCVCVCVCLCVCVTVNLYIVLLSSCLSVKLTVYSMISDVMHSLRWCEPASELTCFWCLIRNDVKF